MKTVKLGFWFILLFAIVSCDDQNNFFGPPPYDVEGNLARDMPIIEDFLETYAVDSLYRIHDPSGVVIIVQEEGTASRPIPGNTVYINYTGSLLDGTVFDTNLEDVAIEHGLHDEDRTYRIFQFGLGQSGVIEGFHYGFTRLRSGSKAILIIPSARAYRDDDSIERIPADSNLVFEVELLGFD